MFSRTPGRMRKLLRKVRGIGASFVGSACPLSFTPARQAHDAYSETGLCTGSPPDPAGGAPRTREEPGRMEKRQREHTYARTERERRFLMADVPASASVTATWLIRDRYLNGTRLRLRRSDRPDGGAPELKLTQKIPADQPGAVQGLITNTYLSQGEYDLLASLPAAVLSKTRLSVPPLGVDVFDGPLTGLVLAEAEFASDAEALAFPFPAGVRGRGHGRHALHRRKTRPRNPAGAAGLARRVRNPPFDASGQRRPWTLTSVGRRHCSAPRGLIPPRGACRAATGPPATGREGSSARPGCPERPAPPQWRRRAPRGARPLGARPRGDPTAGGGTVRRSSPGPV